MDDRFYIIVQGRVSVQRLGRALGYLGERRLLRRVEAMYASETHRNHQIDWSGDRDEGQLQFAGAGVGGASIALQPGVLAQHDRTPAECRTGSSERFGRGSLSNSIIAYA